MANSVAGPRRPPLPVRLTRYLGRWTEPSRRQVRAAVRARRLASTPASKFDDGRDLARQWQWSACYAPLTSMYLDQFGIARACCQNTDHPLGDIGTSTLREIWDSAATTQLRQALAGGNLDQGCDFCAWQVSEDGASSPFSRLYDTYPVGYRRRPRWPKQLEFSVTNTCNLQCVMCNGDWSSTIRSRREGRPPLPSAYPERFFEELVDFIPHLREAKFTGGEPFLGSEPLRIMDLLAEHGSANLIGNVVTNATTYTDRVDRFLHSVKPWVTVSLDGGTPEVYERIRVGASFSKVLANIDRFAAVVRRRGAGMNLSHCLMVDNWQTFPQFLQLAESRGLDVFVNTVRFPAQHSLFHLPAADLAEVVSHLSARSGEVAATVSGNRLSVWHDQLDALARRASEPNWPSALGQPPELREPIPVAAPTRRHPTTAHPDDR